MLLARPNLVILHHKNRNISDCGCPCGQCTAGIALDSYVRRGNSFSLPVRYLEEHDIGLALGHLSGALHHSQPASSEPENARLHAIASRSRLLDNPDQRWRWFRSSKNCVDVGATTIIHLYVAIRSRSHRNELAEQSTFAVAICQARPDQPGQILARSRGGTCATG
jgi:hypothetical protein